MQKNKIWDDEAFKTGSYDAVKSALKPLKASNAFEYPSAGIQQTIDTLTYIVQDVLETKYYETPFPLTDYVKIEVGGGAYLPNLFQFTTKYTGSTFAECIINPASTGIHNDAVSNVQVDGIFLKNNFFRNDYSLSQEELRMAAAGRISFDLYREKEQARKKLWDLGIQDTHFLGLNNTDVLGLLNQPEAAVNTTLLPADIGAMTTEQIKNFAGTAIMDYYAQTNYTFYPNRLYMPSQSYGALGVPYGDTFGMPTLREVIERAFKDAGAPQDFKIVHARYGFEAATGGRPRYVLYNNDPSNVVRYIPLNYTPMPLFPVGSLDMISQSQGQFTGVWLKRPSTMLYMDVQA